MKVPLTSWLLESSAVLLLTAELCLYITIQLDSGGSLQGGFSAKPKRKQRKAMIKDKIIINRRISGGMLRDRGKGDQWLYLGNQWSHPVFSHRKIHSFFHHQSYIVGCMLIMSL